MLAFSPQGFGPFRLLLLGRFHLVGALAWLGHANCNNIPMRQTRSRIASAIQNRKELNTTVVQLCHLLGLSCARYRKFKSLQAPELILKVEALLMKKYMSRLVEAETRCVN